VRTLRRAAQRGEEGFTLIETALTVLIMAIVLACAFPTVPLFFGEQTSIQNTFGAVDQLVLASETVTRFVHEAVDNSPGGLVSPFVSASANAVTFTANTGIAGAPEEVVVQVANGAGGTRTFGMSLYPATSGSCPPAGAGCTYTGGADNTVLINYLTNGTGGSPVFSYLLQGGESCAGPPPGAAPTTLASALTSGSQYTSVSVNGLTSPVSVGDSVYLGSGPNAQLLTATAATTAGAGTKVITVSNFTASTGYPVTTTGVYDNAWGLVPNTVPTTLSGSVSGSVTALPVHALGSAVAVGDQVVVGTGATTQTFTVKTAEPALQTTIPVNTVAANTTYNANTEVYDSSCSNTQLSQITAVSLNLQATKTPGGQPTGYQSQAYLLSPTYNTSVG